MEAFLNRVAALVIGVMFLAAAAALGYVLRSWWALPYIAAPVWLGMLLVGNAFKSEPADGTVEPRPGEVGSNSDDRDPSERIAA
jgi:energy-coupling factor transporter transmembrane protein EcfT